jgi:hypothetical protein
MIGRKIRIVLVHIRMALHPSWVSYGIEDVVYIEGQVTFLQWLGLR